MLIIFLAIAVRLLFRSDQPELPLLSITMDKTRVGLAIATVEDKPLVTRDVPEKEPDDNDNDVPPVDVEAGEPPVVLIWWSGEVE